MTTYAPGTTAKGGFYFNIDEWDMLVVPEQGQVLPGAAGNRYVKMPALALFLAAPLLGAAFAMFMPFIGLALVGKFAIEKTVHTVRILTTGPIPAEAAATATGPRTQGPAVPTKANEHEPMDPEC